MSMDFNVNMNEYLPLRDVVFETLRQAILRGDLKPGERLLEVKLGEKLGVSRTPIREAIRKLELEGLVIMIPRKGAEVAKITEKSLRDVLEVRKALEGLAVRLACDRITNEQLRQLKEAADVFEDSLKTEDVTYIAAMDVGFHDIIYHATENDRLFSMLLKLREQMYRYRVEYLKRKDAYPILLKEHDKIVEMIEQRKHEEAQQMVCAHIDNQVTAVAHIIRMQD